MPRDYRSMFSRDFLGSWDLGGREVTVTIRKVEAGTLTGNGGRKDKKPVVYFEGKEKALALNKTNAKQIAQMYSSDVDNWVGKQIVIYPTTTTFGSETVDCIRVRPGKPKAVRRPQQDQKQPEPNPLDRQPGEDADEPDQAAGGEA